MDINVRKLEKLTRQARSLVVGFLNAQKPGKALREANVVLNEMSQMILAAKKGGRK